MPEWFKTYLEGLTDEQLTELAQYSATTYIEDDCQDILDRRHPDLTPDDAADSNKKSN
jgi:adenylate kinase